MSVMIENSNLIECGKCDHDHASEEECTAAEPNNITQRCYDELEKFLYQDAEMLERFVNGDLDLEEEIGYLVDDADLTHVDYPWIEAKLLMMRRPRPANDSEIDFEIKCFWCNARGCDTKTDNGAYIHKSCA